jgi:D-arabinose 5-phosphate isomerase GutQ
MATTNTEKKITKAMRYAQIREILVETEADSALVDFVDHEVELLEKKNSTEKKPTATQVANAALKDAILRELVESGKAETVTDLMKSVPELVEADCSNQRVSALLSQLVKSEQVERITEKRKSYFKAVVGA